MSQSLACKISHIRLDYNRCQWTIAETKVLRSLCIGDNALLRFPFVILFPGTTVETNLKSVTSLDVHLDVATGTHKPYRKPNNPPVYINTSYIHPRVITRNISDAVGKRISSLSSNKETFDQAADMYNAALESNGYTETIKFNNGVDFRGLVKILPLSRRAGNNGRPWIHAAMCDKTYSDICRVSKKYLYHFDF